MIAVQVIAGGACDTGSGAALPERSFTATRVCVAVCAPGAFIAEASGGFEGKREGKREFEDKRGDKRGFEDKTGGERGFEDKTLEDRGQERVRGQERGQERV
jgi:hypothetical protein